MIAGRVEPQEVSRDTARGIAKCEVCGREETAQPWPRGWGRSGYSRIRVLNEQADPRLWAWWCPAHVQVLMGPRKHWPGWKGEVTKEEAVTIRDKIRAARD